MIFEGCLARLQLLPYKPGLGESYEVALDLEAPEAKRHVGGLEGAVQDALVSLLLAQRPVHDVANLLLAHLIDAMLDVVATNLEYEGQTILEFLL